MAIKVQKGPAPQVNVRQSEVVGGNAKVKNTVVTPRSTGYSLESSFTPSPAIKNKPPAQQQQGGPPISQVSTQAILSGQPVTLNLNSYQDRLKLLEVLNARYPLPPGMSNPMDGIYLQTQWQLNSGRDQTAWWSQVNSSLTVWQLQALQQQGVLTNITITPLPAVTMPPSVAADIQAYYQQVSALSAQYQSGNLPQSSYAAAEDALQNSLWTFHTSALHSSLAQSTTALASLPPGEQEFADAWGNHLVGVLAAANFPTHGTVVSVLNADLPNRLVVPGDLNPQIPLPPGVAPLPPKTILLLHGMVAMRPHSAALELQVRAFRQAFPQSTLYLQQAIEAVILSGQAAGQVGQALLGTIGGVLGAVGQTVEDAIAALEGFLETAPYTQEELDQMHVPTPDQTQSATTPPSATATPGEFSATPEPAVTQAPNPTPPEPTATPNR
jgi:hypothetical protein